MGKKRIKGTTLILHLGVTNEKIGDYVGIIKKYFKDASHHYQDYNPVANDAILFYSYFPRDMDCRGCCNIPSQIDVSKKTSDKIGDAFYDFKRMDMPCGLVNRIHYGSKFVGFHCPKNNVLSLSDIVHVSGHEKHLKEILETLESKDLLHPIEISTTKTTISLGTDPEMESIINGVTVPATELIQLSNREKVYISHDGHTQPQRELRPDPGATPEELVENLKDLIKISSFFGEDLSVLGKTCPLGGHIHIGNTAPSKEVVEVLDYFLFPFLEFNSVERKKSKYGKPGDVRVQPHGFEYRTPPPAWLLTPNLALKTLELTKIIVENIINNIDVDISDDYNWDEYKENLSQLGFNNEWIIQFENELMWARNHLNEPLAKTWGVEVPKEYQIKKDYRHIMKPDPIPIRSSQARMVTFASPFSEPLGFISHDPSPEDFCIPDSEEEERR